VMKFKTDHKGNVIGAYGPGNEYFTKVERHSDIKYKLKNVKRSKGDCDNDNDVDYEEKEGNVTNGGNDVDKQYKTSFEWKGGKCAKNKCVGRVSIDYNFVVSFGMVVHGKNCNEWESILHVGAENKERSPGIWLHPKSMKLHVRLSDTANWNTGYDPNMELEKGKLYKIKLQCVDNDVSLSINGKVHRFSSNVYHIARYKAPVFVSDPWHAAANVTISDLKIFSPK